MANQSLYRALRAPGNEELSPGKFDGKFASHLSIAKEIIHHKKEKNRIWNFSLRGLLHGGLYEPSIDESASALQRKTVFEDPSIYNVRLPAYKRIDASVSRTIANPKVRWRYSLDIQNLGGFTNIGFHYYDPFLQRIEAQEQLGIIPVFSVQASW